MTRPHPKGKSTVIGHFWQPGEPFFPVTDAFITSDAWRTLKPTQRNILLDWLLWYYKCSNSDTRNLGTVGFKYAWSICRIDCAESTFGKARDAIEERRFFVAPPALQTARGNDAKLYVPGDWMNWRAPREARVELRGREKGKETRIRRHQKRRVDYISKLEVVPEIQGCHPRNSGGSHTPEYQGDHPPVIPGDTSAQNDGSHPRNSSGSIDLSMSTHVSKQKPDHDPTSKADAVPHLLESGEFDLNDPMVANVLNENQRAARWAPKRGEMHRMEALAAVVGAV